MEIKKYYKVDTMRYFMQLAGILILTIGFSTAVYARERAISEKELHDKISAFWLGQLVGNYFGLPFENEYIDEPVPFLVDRIYTFKDDETIHLNRDDWRGYIPIFIDAVEGAFADDDTDIEFVTLHAVEKYGLDITYPEITEMQTRAIIEAALNLKEKGIEAKPEIMVPLIGKLAEFTCQEEIIRTTAKMVFVV